MSRFILYALVIALIGTALIAGLMRLWEHRCRIIKAKEEHRYDIKRKQADVEIKKIKGDKK